MSDLISRQEAIDSLTEIVMNLKNVYGDMGSAVNGARECIKSLPSVEPERKTGVWEVQLSTGSDRPFIWWKCSECGNVIYSETEHDRKEFHAFCGRCGADMRGV